MPVSSPGGTSLMMVLRVPMRSDWNLVFANEKRGGEFGCGGKANMRVAKANQTHGRKRHLGLNKNSHRLAPRNGRPSRGSMFRVVGSELSRSASLQEVGGEKKKPVAFRSGFRSPNGASVITRMHEGRRRSATL
ncbi:hypothetical protein L249_8402 [Ophiocordyceps polyrhachis-furcata BCC 54312]|uniref:Uncharacterized protein n=1 Tax=Ophiocordyceps polyrhachis-furcata BCC 54312 TaxID=1330021 RepID=A0A367L695_9HYPO|nr:hypothetical protein L249_8402 [Ophiocordyceps polyrhachis-furcata BCC 54312]